MKKAVKVILIILVFLGAFFGSMFFASADLQIGFGKNISSVFLDFTMPLAAQTMLFAQGGSAEVIGIDVFPEINQTIVFISEPDTEEWFKIVQLIRRIDHEVFNTLPVLDIVKHYYGEMYWDEIDNPLNVVALNGAFVPLIDLKNDFGHGIRFQNNSQLNITLDGLYKIDYSVNYLDSNNQQYQWGIAKNSEIINGTIIRTQINHNSPRVASGTKFVEFLENDLITLEVSGVGSFGTLEVLNANVNIIRISPLE